MSEGFGVQLLQMCSNWSDISNALQHPDSEAAFGYNSCTETIFSLVAGENIPHFTALCLSRCQVGAHLLLSRPHSILTTSLALAWIGAVTSQLAAVTVVDQPCCDSSFHLEQY